MTYPDRELSPATRRLAFWIFIISLLVVALILQLAKQETCVSSATMDSTGTIVTTPVTCL